MLSLFRGEPSCNRLPGTPISLICKSHVFLDRASYNKGRFRDHSATVICFTAVIASAEMIEKFLVLSLRQFPQRSKRCEFFELVVVFQVTPLMEAPPYDDRLIPLPVSN
jgi:hypothetical protein